MLLEIKKYNNQIAQMKIIEQQKEIMELREKSKQLVQYSIVKKWKLQKRDAPFKVDGSETGYAFVLKYFVFWAYDLMDADYNQRFTKDIEYFTSSTIRTKYAGNT